jgi:signal transduction histidine kinase
MRRYYNILIIIISLLFISTTVTLIILNRNFKSELIKNYNERSIEIASSITLSARSNLFVGDFFSVYNYIESIAKDRDILFFNIDNNFGKKIKDLNRDIEIRYKPNIKFNNYKNTNILVSQQKNIFYIKYPLFFDLDKKEKWGYLIYGFSINKIKNIIKKLDAIFIALLVSLLLIACILVFIARKFFAQTLNLLISNFEQLIVNQSREKDFKLLKEYTPIVNRILNLKTTIVKQQQELQEKSRYEAVAKMSAELAHDIKNPLNVIKSQVGKLVIIEEIKKEEAISAKDIVEEQINKITSLIKGIMDSTKPIRVNLVSDNINSILSDYVGTITKYLDKNIVESEVGTGTKFNINLPI